MPGIRWSTRSRATACCGARTRRPRRAPPARSGLHDAVVVAVARLQVARDRVQHLWFVVDGQDDGLGHGVTPPRRRAPSGLPPRRPVTTDRQPNGEASSTGRRLEVELAVVPLHHDVPGYRRPRPGPLSRRLGREEHVEQLREVLRWDARPVILDLDLDPVARTPRTDDQGALPGIASIGVVDEVGPHLVELARVGLDRGQVIGVLAHHRDADLELAVQDDEGVLEAARRSTSWTGDWSMYV